MEIFREIPDESEAIDKCLEDIQRNESILLDVKDEQVLREKLRNLRKSFKVMWVKCNRTLKTFEKNTRTLLRQIFNTNSSKTEKGDLMNPNQHRILNGADPHYPFKTCLKEPKDSKHPNCAKKLLKIRN